MPRILLYRGVVILAPRVFETHGRVSSGWAQPAKQLGSLQLSHVVLRIAHLCCRNPFPLRGPPHEVSAQKLSGLPSLAPSVAARPVRRRAPVCGKR